MMEVPSDYKAGYEKARRQRGRGQQQKSLHPTRRLPGAPRAFPEGVGVVVGGDKPGSRHSSNAGASATLPPAPQRLVVDVETTISCSTAGPTPAGAASAAPGSRGAGRRLFCCGQFAVSALSGPSAGRKPQAVRCAERKLPQPVQPGAFGEAAALLAQGL